MSTTQEALADKLHELGFRRDEDWFLWGHSNGDDFECIHIDTIAALSLPAVGEAVGEWQLVPKEYTDEMLRVGKKNLHGEGGAISKVRRIWLGMLAAAPRPPQPESAPTGAQPLLAQPDTSCVICPKCCHQFRAIPVDVQRLMLDAGFVPPFTNPPASSEPAPPAAIYHGDHTIDCGEHGHHHLELLTMIPAGAYLYTHPYTQPELDAARARAKEIHASLRVESAQPAQASTQVPVDVKEAAHFFVSNGYRGPLPMARLVFDWVDAQPLYASPVTPEGAA